MNPNAVQAIRIEVVPQFRDYLAFNARFLLLRLWWMMILAIMLLVCFAVTPFIPFGDEPTTAAGAYARA